MAISVQGLAAAWIVAGVLTAVALLWSKIVGLPVAALDLAATYIALAFLLAMICQLVGRFADRRGLSQFAAGCRRNAVFWGVMSVVSTVSNAMVILTYLMIHARLPLIDQQLARLDLLLGFDWLAWFDFVHDRHWLYVSSFYLYESTLPATGVALLYSALAGNTARCHEMLWIFIITGIVITIFCGLTPALHAPALYLSDRYHNALGTYYPFLPEINALRDGTLSEIDLTKAQGLVCFPSFHTVLIILFGYTLRGTRLFWPALLLGIATLPSLLNIGGHYLVDIPAGAAVTLVAIALVRCWLPDRVGVQEQIRAGVVA